MDLAPEPYRYRWLFSLRHRTLGPEALAAVGAEAVEALRTLHALGLAHGNLSLDNVCIRGTTPAGIVRSWLCRGPQPSADADRCCMPIDGERVRVQPHVVLANYGLHHMTSGGANVEFPLG